MNDNESITDFLQRHEDLWSEGLKTVSLVAELDVDDTVAAKALGYLGIKYRGQGGEANYLNRRRMLRDYPAVFLVSTVSLIAERYDNGGVWPQLADALGVSNSQTLHSEWGDAFLRNLQAFNLPTFDGVENLKQHYVSRMTLHSGIPTRTMNDYFRIISEQLAKDPDMTAEEFVSWALVKIKSGTMYGVDVPVKQFIEYGKEFAVDLTDRCIELIVRLGENDGVPDDTALPPRFTKEATRLMQGGKIKGVSGRSGANRSVRPRFLLDPHTYLPSLLLPSVDALEGGDTAVWRVAFGDNEPLQVSAPTLWPGEPSPERLLPLPKPVRQATVDFNEPSYSTKTIDFIDGSNPMLFFDETGTMLSRGIDLPSGNVWVLVPGAATELDSDVDLHVTTTVQLPTGWDGWSLSLVDIRGATFIHHARSGTKRLVREHVSARILMDDPLSFVKTLRGAPVYTSRPDIELPDDAEWQVALISSTGAEIGRVRTAEGESIDSLWGREPVNIIGEYTIKIRGPLGRGTTRTFYLAEGLKESASQAFRRMQTDGLEAASVRLNLSASNDAEQTVHFDADTIEASIEISSQRFMVSVPYAHVSYDEGGSSVHPITVFTEDVVESPGSILLYTDETPSAVFEVLSNGVMVQRVDGLSRINGAYRFNLAKISETLDWHPYVTIVFGDEKMKLATVRPKSLFESAKLCPDRTGVKFSECTNVRGLRAVFYSINAPWVKPQAAEVDNSVCKLPENLIDAGELLVFLEVADEWSMGDSQLPDWPSGEKIAIIENKGWYTGGNEEESAISEFLSGKGKSLPAHINDIGLLWVVYARTVKLYENRHLVREDGRSIVTKINDSLARQVHDALIEIARSPLENRMIPYVLISSGMVWSDITPEDDSVLPEWSIRNSLPMALLSGADHDWSEDELSAAVGILGEIAIEIFEGRDTASEAGGFGPEVEILDADPSRQQQIFENLNLVPEGLLHADSRVKASLSVFGVRHDDRIRWMVDEAGRLTMSTREIIKRIAPREVFEQFEKRLGYTRNDGWRGLPAASLGLAIMARYASRGNMLAKEFFEVEGQDESIGLNDLIRWKRLNEQRHGWAEFAKLVPDMVMIDIILAELIIAGAEKRKVKNNAE